MKSFNHSTDTNKDPKIKKLLLKFGLIGKAIYFELLELVADRISLDTLKNGNAGFIDESWDMELFSLECRLEEEKVLEILDYLSQINLIDSGQWQKYQKIFIPKIFYRSKNYLKLLIKNSPATDFVNITLIFTKFGDFLQSKPDFSKLLQILANSGTNTIQYNRLDIKRGYSSSNGTEVLPGDGNEVNGKEEHPPAPQKNNEQEAELCNGLKLYFLDVMKSKGFDIEDESVIAFCEDQVEKLLGFYKSRGTVIADYFQTARGWVRKKYFDEDIVQKLYNKGIGPTYEVEIKTEFEELQEELEKRRNFWLNPAYHYEKKGIITSDEYNFLKKYPGDYNPERLREIFSKMKEEFDMPTKKKADTALTTLIGLGKQLKELDNGGEPCTG